MAKYAAFTSKLQIDISSTLTDIAGIIDLSGPTYATDVIDSTTHDSASQFKEKLVGAVDAGEVSLEIAWDPDETSAQQELVDRLQDRASDTFKIVFPSAVTADISFTGYVTGFEVGLPLDGLLTASVTITVTGKPTIS